MNNIFVVYLGHGSSIKDFTFNICHLLLHPGSWTTIQKPGVFLFTISSHGANLLYHLITNLLYKSSVAFFYVQHLTARCESIPYPALNEAGRLGESRYAKFITPRFGNKLNQNCSIIQAILVMTLLIGDELKRAALYHTGTSRLKDALLVAVRIEMDLLETYLRYQTCYLVFLYSNGGRGASLPTVCLRHRITVPVKL